MVASQGGEIALAEAMAGLRDGGRALDAVELAVRAVEADHAEHYVGVGGIPNLLGEVELDASVMEGRTRRAGCVAGVQHFPYPVTIARAVMERLPQHLLLVGRGAERFADDLGLPRGETLTEEARRIWRQGLEPAALAEIDADDARYRRAAADLVKAMGPPDAPYGTVNVLALDRHGDLVVGVSTSGYPWKHPGRVGDSAVIGAGNYCDNRFGGAACTGRGELAIRSGTARTVVQLLAAGADPAEACRRALADAMELPDDFPAPLQALCLLPDGRHGGAGTRPGGTYAVMAETDDTYRMVERGTV